MDFPKFAVVMRTHGYIVRMLLLSIGMFVYYTGQAQIVNIEGSRLEEDSTGVQGEFNVFYNFTKNTQSISQLKASSALQFRWKKNVILPLADVNMVFSKNTDFVFKGYGHLRYNRLINKWLTAEAFSQAQFDRVLFIQLRWLTGAGPRFKLYKAEKAAFFLGTLAMYEYEEEKETGIIRRDWRGSAYLSAQIEVSETFSIAHITYYQPLFTDVSDFRLSTSTSLEFTITKALTFKSAFNLMYDSNPVQSEEVDIVNLTYSISNGLSFSF